MRALLSLGSNLGDRLHNVRRGLDLLAGLPRSQLAAVSPGYETEPWGVADQPPFVNLAAALETELAPLELLDAVKGIEAAVGRRPGGRWGPRVLDIDIVLFGNVSLAAPELTLPHPAFRERAFVLVPLADIAPEAVDPETGLTVRALRGRLGPQPGVRQLTELLLEPLRLEPHRDRDGIVTVQEKPSPCPPSLP